MWRKQWVFGKAFERLKLNRTLAGSQTTTTKRTTQFTIDVYVENRNRSVATGTQRIHSWSEHEEVGSEQNRRVSIEKKNPKGKISTLTLSGDAENCLPLAETDKIVVKDVIKHYDSFLCSSRCIIVTRQADYCRSCIRMISIFVKVQKSKSYDTYYDRLDFLINSFSNHI